MSHDRTPEVLRIPPGERLNPEPLEALAAGTLAAVRLPGVVPEADCATISQRYLAHPIRRAHNTVPNLDLLGVSHYSAIRDPLTRERYFRQPNPYVRVMRELAAGCVSPLDATLDVFRRGWPGGVAPESLEYGRPMSPFVVRVYAPGHGVEPHQDVLTEEAPDSPAARGLVGQFALNLYLAMPEVGGELELYLCHYPPVAYDALRLPGADDYAIDPRRLGSPLLRLRPVVGEVILFNSRLTHAVAAGQGRTTRVTLSAFMGMRGRGSPLTVWA